MDAQMVTSVTLCRTLWSLGVIFAISVFFNPPSHIAHWIIMVAYLGLLVLGLVGAAKRSRVALVLYSIVQIVLVSLTVMSVVGFSVYFFVMARSQAHADVHHELQNFTVTLESQNQTVSFNETVSTDEHLMSEMSRGEFARFLIFNGLSILFFLIVLALKFRSIVLALKLTKMIGQMPYRETDTVSADEQEMIERASAESLRDLDVPKAAQKETVATPSAPVAAANGEAPAFFYVAHPQFVNMPQAAAAPSPFAYPGMPMMVVDQYGNTYPMAPFQAPAPEQDTKHNE